MRVKRFHSWGEFRASVIDSYLKKSSEKRGGLWFRGQSDAAWPLQTTLDRFKSFSSNRQRSIFHGNLMQAFREEIIGLGIRHELPSGDGLELLARHHGLPSMLLDWTRSPFIAAYFAFEDALVKEENAVAIWAFNRTRLDDPSEIDLIDDRELLWYNPRALAQAGIFMRVKSSTPTEDLLQRALFKYEIPVCEAVVAMRELLTMNITARNLFRDYDGAARAAKVVVQL
jgi:hypothetical protein